MAQNTGKIFGGVAGLFLGGPIGAILGVLAGSWFDKNMMLEDGKQHYYNPEVVFWSSLSALVAKLSKADGAVTKDEVSLFKSFLIKNNVSPDLQKICAEVFNQAKTSPHGYEEYAAEIFEAWKYDQNVLSEIFLFLINLANIDGNLHHKEEQTLRRVAALFQFSEQDYRRFMAMSYNKPQENIYDILKVSPNASISEIKQAFRKLVKKYHPDKLSSKGLPQQVINESKERMAKINDAYEQILKKHGEKR